MMPGDTWGSKGSIARAELDRCSPQSSEDDPAHPGRWGSLCALLIASLRIWLDLAGVPSAGIEAVAAAGLLQLRGCCEFARAPQLQYYFGCRLALRCSVHIAASVAQTP